MRPAVSEPATSTSVDQVNPASAATPVTSVQPETTAHPVTTARSAEPVSLPAAARPPAPVHPAEPVRLAEADWRAREAAHHVRADEFSRGWRERQGTGTKHPVDDFLFTYYPVRPSILRRWHPGAGVVLEDAANDERAHWKWYEPTESPTSTADTSSAPTGTAETSNALTVDTASFATAHAGSIRFIVKLLSATAARPAQLSCFGLHEWAMVYRADASAASPHRHDVPLRLGQEGTDAVVENNRITCTHFDAFRFFTPPAVPLNRLETPTRENQPQTEQPGCLHAGMDVYKWATKLGPLIPGELLLDCFELARDIRELDMRAAPYDLADWGYEPVRIEIAEGRADYARQQRDFAERSNALRRRVIDAVQLAQ